MSVPYQAQLTADSTPTISPVLDEEVLATLTEANLPWEQESVNLIEHGAELLRVLVHETLPNTFPA